MEVHHAKFKIMVETEVWEWESLELQWGGRKWNTKSYRNSLCRQCAFSLSESERATVCTSHV